MLNRVELKRMIDKIDKECITDGVSEANRAKRKLETSIRQLLLEFESTTGLEVYSVEFERYRQTNPHSLPAIEDVEVVIKL